MKKIICLILVLLIVLSTLASCGVADTIRDNVLPGTEQNNGTNNNNGNNNNGNNNNPGDGSCLTKEMHVDADNNGVCERCTADVVVTLDIYGINDLHGKVLDTDSQIGVDELTTYLKGAETRDEEYLSFPPVICGREVQSLILQRVCSSPIG